MAEIKVYGSSDDLIEVEGPGGDEFSGGDGPRFLHFSEGTVLKVWYGKGGVWKIERVKEGKADCAIAAKEQEDDDGYTDTATLTGNIKCDGCWGSPDGPTSDDLSEKIIDWTDRLRGHDLDDYPPEKLLALWRAIEAL